MHKDPSVINTLNKKHKKNIEDLLSDGISAGIGLGKIFVAEAAKHDGISYHKTYKSPNGITSFGFRLGGERPVALPKYIVIYKE